MRRQAPRRLLATAAALAFALAASAVPAQAAPGDPLFTFVPTTATKPKVLPVGYLTGPCGLAAGANGSFYVSDYYHHTVDFFALPAPPNQPVHNYAGQITGVDPLDGPCGLALDSTSRLYVNSFDRGVLRFNPSPNFGAGVAIAGAGVDDTHPTGVTVDPTTDNVYVNNRTYITAYNPSGAQLMDGPNPLQIGLGTLGEGYGLAIDATGRLYVADAADDTVKVYDPATSLTTPTKTIAGPPGGFSSLRHGALAVDRQSGALYVVDNLQPEIAEKPAAQVEVFAPDAAPANVFLGVLKYKIIDALPAGIAVDNSASGTQGTVYVTSGNTNQAGIYGYGPGSQIASAAPPSFGLGLSASGAGTGVVRSDLGAIECSGSCEAQIRSGATVTLSAIPAPGSTFDGWSGGGCSGTGECTVQMDQAKMIRVEFEALPAPFGAAPGPAIAAPAAAAAAATTAPRAQLRHRARQRRHAVVRRASISAKRSRESR
jgi:DNA-binding beta-propeller fold protein YncE